MSETSSSINSVERSKPGPAMTKRDAQGGLVRGTLVLAETGARWRGAAVVGEEEDDGVVELAGFFEAGDVACRRSRRWPRRGVLVAGNPVFPDPIDVVDKEVAAQASRRDSAFKCIWVYCLNLENTQPVRNLFGSFELPLPPVDHSAIAIIQLLRVGPLESRLSRIGFYCHRCPDLRHHRCVRRECRRIGKRRISSTVISSDKLRSSILVWSVSVLNAAAISLIASSRVKSEKYSTSSSTNRSLRVRWPIGNPEPEDSAIAYVDSEGHRIGRDVLASRREFE